LRQFTEVFIDTETNLLNGLTTDPTEQTLLAGDGVGDIGDGVPVDRFQLDW
jgi:hypothetical protein